MTFHSVFPNKPLLSAPSTGSFSLTSTALILKYQSKPSVFPNSLSSFSRSMSKLSHFWYLSPASSPSYIASPLCPMLALVSLAGFLLALTERGASLAPLSDISSILQPPLPPSRPFQIPYYTHTPLPASTLASPLAPWSYMFQTTKMTIYKISCPPWPSSSIPSTHQQKELCMSPKAGTRTSAAWFTATRNWK